MDFYGLTSSDARSWAAAIGLPAYRGDQLVAGLYRPGVARFADIPGLPRELCARLDAGFALLPAAEHRRQESLDGTVKSLLRLSDGKLVECVSIPTSDRHTVCVSSQVGCAVGCTFCASGQEGVERDLSAGEIVYQVWFHHQRRAVTNVVFMGSGEPMFNYDNVRKAINVLSDPAALGLGRRRFTISTSGVPARIRQLAVDEPQITLALSLHAADDETRSRIVPLNRRWPLAELLAAMDDYSRTVNRRMTFEYVLLAGDNMGDEHARRLAEIARRYGAHINLMPYNPVAGSAHVRPMSAQVADFAAKVSALGGHCTVRGQRGADIDAACGQLRRRVAAGVQTPGDPGVVPGSSLGLPPPAPIASPSP
jgi:23S rRNA (adenine2503-C2)-methyltransferase